MKVGLPAGCGRRQGLNGALAAGAVICVTGNLLSPGSIPVPAWAALLLGFAVLNFRNLRTSAATVLSIAILLGAAALLWGEFPLGPAVRQAGFFFALLLILQILGRVATRSPDVIAGAGIVVSRPPGLRYLFLTFGTHLFGLFLNIGSVILMMSMLSSRLGQESEDTVRTSSLAVLRGFAATPMWSPLSLSVLVILSLVSDVSFWHLAPLGIAAAFVYMITGYWLESRNRRIVRAKLLSPQEKRIILRIVARIVCLIAGAFMLVALFDLRLIEGVLISASAVTFVWSVAQKIVAGPAAASFLGDLCGSATSMVNELSLICGSSFIGSILTAMILTLGGIGEPLTAPISAAIAAFIPLAVVLGGMAAINPLVTASILAGTLDAAWPAEAKLWLAMALTLGWGLTTSGMPFNATVLMTARTVSRSPFEIAFKWNGRLTAIGIVMAGATCALGAYLAA